MYIMKQSVLARQAIAVGRRNHWRFQVIECDEMPKEPILKSEWWYEPTDKYSIPEDGRERISAIELAGIKTVGFMVAHEAPRLLAAPKPQPKPMPKPQTKPKVEIDFSGVVQTITRLVVAGFVGLVGMVGLVFAVLLDPAIIVVLEDGTWVKVMTWYE